MHGDEGELLVRHKLSVEDYHRLGEAGVLGKDDRVELIEGELIEMSPVGWDHAATVNGLARALIFACEGKAVVSSQNPVRLDGFSEPLPDFAVFRARPNERHAGKPPGPAELLLLVEVSDSSVRYDRRVKLPLYARHGIREYWVVDLTKRKVDVYREPGRDGYGSEQSIGPGARVTLAVAADIVVALDGVFD